MREQNNTIENPGKAVVTGGAGFIGSHLVDRLIELGYEVVALDDLSTGRTQNIAHLKDNPRFTFVQGSILDRDLLAKTSRDATYVFHQAAIPSVPRSMKDPVATHEANATGTLYVLMAARDAKVKKVVVASSSSVYGDTPELPKREDMTPRPLSPYAVSKLAAESYCSVFTTGYGLPTVSLRYFNVYGPRQDPDSEYAAVIPKFIQAALQGEPLTIYGDGQQTRDFTYVADVVEANIVAAMRETTGVFNVAHGEAVTINTLAELVRSLTKSDSDIRYEPPRAGDVLASTADNSRLVEVGHAPRTSLEDGMRSIITGLR